MKHLYLLIFLLTTISISAQLKEFHITEREADETPVVQGNTQFADNALILVYSALPNLNFRSTIGGINQQRYNQRANRYEILINPQRQILFVAAPGYIEQRVALVNPSPKEVFYFEIEERSGQDEISVIFIVEPEDAQLFVDNLPTSINKTVSVPLGTVNVRLEREGYRPISQPIVTSPEKVNFEFRMQEVEPEIVHINANEPDARVVFDGMEKGITDQSNRLSLFLYPGEYTVEVQKSGYLTSPQTIVVEEDKENAFLFNLEKNTGVLVFDIRPETAKVMVNKSPIGDKSEIERPPGRYRIDIELPDHDPFSETVDLDRGAQKTIRATLEPHRGSLLFSVAPSNAQVVLKNEDGKEVKKWEGLQLIKDLPAGEYEVEISLSEYISQKEKIRIVKDARATLEVALEKGLELKISSLPAPQIIQASTKYPDNAIILVNTTLPNLQFRSTVGVNSQRYNKVAERYEILVPPQRQTLFVKASGIDEIRIAQINPSPKESFLFEVESSGQENFDEEEVFNFASVDEKPVFPGCENEKTEEERSDCFKRSISMHVASTFVLPEGSQKSGVVIINFTINRDGYISDAKIVRSVDFAVDVEAMRVVNELPKFKPAKQNGRPVRMSFNLPINVKY
ncbi:MAG: TonB family protein [Cryomorphaceae bacterium]|nr:TonB family protein [Cryomorphaceae bacterium]